MVFHKNTAEKLLNSPFMQRLPLSYNCKKLIAFTLAEVLITLLIIGIVASLVIPALIQDTQDAELKAAWKKTYSSFSQTTLRMVFDNGGSLKGVFTSDNDVYNIFSKYISIVKYCPYRTASGNCWHSGAKYMDNDPITWPNGTGFITNDGNLIFLDSRSTYCNVGNNHCLSISVDINGFKGPNIVGKDILGFCIFTNSIKPRGTVEGGYISSCNDKSTGWGCSAEYLYQ